MIACVDTFIGAVFFVAGMILMVCAAMAYFASARWYRRAGAEGAERLQVMEEIMARRDEGEG